MSDEIQQKKNYEFFELMKRMKDSQMTRRQFAVRAAALGFGVTTIGAALAACGGSSPTATPAEVPTTAPAAATTAPAAATTAPAAATTAPAASTPASTSANVKGVTLNIMAQGVMISDDIVKRCQADTGLILNTTATTEPDMMTKMLTGGVNQYDVIQGATPYMEPMWNAGVLMEVPIDKLPSMKNNLLPIFTDPTNPATGSDHYSVNVFWKDPDKQTTFKIVPALWNLEGWGYLADKVPELNKSSDLSYNVMFDTKYKGHVGIWNDSVWAPGWVAVTLAKMGKMQLTTPPSKLTTAEIDEVMAFLTDLKKQGQYRTYWSDYGEIVNLMSSGEVWMADCWNPIASAVNAVTPCVFTNPTEGARGWAHGLVVSKGTQNPEACFAYIDWCMSGWRMAQVAPMGLYDATNGNVKQFMKPEDYAFWYEGKGRDVGSMAHRLPNLHEWVEYPAEPEYQLTKWLNFLAS
jgi:putative spermidine/putrescine transport system substrate-binding protein